MTAPSVQLVNLFDHAYDNFVATARTCYSSKGIITPPDVSGANLPDPEPSILEQRRQRKYALAQSLFKAGHHTTLQHAHAQFALDKVSRQAIWSFLHAHPFYNSEQVSQRYVSVKEENFHIPPALTGPNRQLYLDCVRRQMADYQHLTTLLTPLAADQYYARFRGRHESKRATSDIQKKSQEAARYVLPVATHAYLYHTVSVVTLLRYYRVCQQFDVPAEQRALAQAMVDALLAREPEFETVLQQPLELEDSPEWQALAHYGAPEIDTANASAITAAYDRDLNGKWSTLASYSPTAQQTVASAVREVLGLSDRTLPDADALDLLLNPARNPVFGDSLNLTTLTKLSRCLFHAHYSFKKVLSHAGDSQDQRHRMTPGSRPVLMRHFTGQPDYIIPEILKQDEAVLARYRDSMDQTWETINTLLQHGATPEHVSYLLPNAVKIRFTESGDLLNLHHKMAMRLCYNAQEEIWRASLDEALAVTAVHPEIGKWFLPPCGHRKHASQKPICPEGDRYCGIPVWRLNREQYERVI